MGVPTSSRPSHIANISTSLGRSPRQSCVCARMQLYAAWAVLPHVALPRVLFARLFDVVCALVVLAWIFSSLACDIGSELRVLSCRAPVLTRWSIERRTEQLAHKREAFRYSLSVLTLAAPFMLILYWAIKCTTAEAGVLESFGLFTGLAASLAYCASLTAVVLRLVTRAGWPAFRQNLRSSVVLVSDGVSSCYSLSGLAVGAAGVAWAARRMGNPEGVYSVC